MVALFFSSPSLPTLSSMPKNLSPKLYTTTFLPRRSLSLLPRNSTDNGPGVVRSTTVEEKEEEEEASSSPQSIDKKKEEVEEKALESNGAAAKAEAPKFRDPRWVGGTWDLKQFHEVGRTDWDAVIDAEARRRKWFEDNPESTSNHDTIIFNTSIIPWWAWMKRFHLPEAELLNGRAAMIGFFMAYLVDGLTGLGVVDQMGNFICKTLMFVSAVGVLLIQKNEDVENLKKLLEETTFYDKQWQATWQDDISSDSKKTG